jgi:hypothetical protein
MRLWIEVELQPGTDPLALADKLLDFMAEDADDVFPEIKVVEDAGWEP